MDYKRSQGWINIPPLQKINLRKDYYAVRWDYKKVDETTVSYIEKQFTYKPSIEEIKELITNYYNEQINTKILQGFVWNDTPIWLSTENQFNYKVAYDLAIQTNGASLPVTFKFGTDETPVYHEFTNLAELQDFYTKAMMFVQNTLVEGWKTKDNIDYNLYTLNE